MSTRTFARISLLTLAALLVLLSCVASGYAVLQDLPWASLNVGVAPQVEIGQNCAMAHQYMKG